MVIYNNRCFRMDLDYKLNIMRLTTEEIVNIIESCLLNQDSSADIVLDLIRTNQIIINVTYVQKNTNESTK